MGSLETVKQLCPRQYNAGMALIRKQQHGFGKGKGVLYKIKDAIDVEEEELYIVPSSSRPGVAGSGFSEYTRAGQIWQGQLAQSKLEV